jgi:hypothetical protein
VHHYVGEKKRNAKRAVSEGNWGHSEPIGMDIYMHIIGSKKRSHVRLVDGDFRGSTSFNR